MPLNVFIALTKCVYRCEQTFTALSKLVLYPSKHVHTQVYRCKQIHSSSEINTFISGDESLSPEINVFSGGKRCKIQTCGTLVLYFFPFPLSSPLLSPSPLISPFLFSTLPLMSLTYLPLYSGLLPPWHPHYSQPYGGRTYT